MSKRHAADPPAFRVLALDGGGIRGIFTASFLATTEDLARGRIADFFDLIVGTSTGGIIGLGVALGIAARRILGLYLDAGPRIFRRSCRARMIFRPKYRNDALAKVLWQVFGDRTLNDTIVPVCIPSYELTSSYPRIWKDDHAVDSPDGGRTPAWKVALATSSAPIYFPGITIGHGDSHVDGGLYANNPVLVGLTEAVRYFGQPLDRVRILSVGAGERAERIPFDRARRMGVWQWKTSLYEHILIAQARNAHEIARRLLSPDRYLRVNLPLEHPYAFDDYAAAKTLIEPGAQAARSAFLEMRRLFFSTPATVGREQKSAAARAAKATSVRAAAPKRASG
jgi:patatin-like phospholipase/acyl hydrolase